MEPVTPTTIATLQTSSWWMNPYFMASFGAVVALGFILFALAYFFFVKLKVGRGGEEADEKCLTCGLTGDMLAKLVPCKEHSGLVNDVEGVKRWILSHEQDYRDLRKLITDHVAEGRKIRG